MSPVRGENPRRRENFITWARATFIAAARRIIGAVTGAESMIRTLIDGGLDVCFANPGTTEMPIVRALDEVPGMRAILGLFGGCAPARPTVTRGCPTNRV
jgi:hypothetical protein